MPSASDAMRARSDAAPPAPPHRTPRSVVCQAQGQRQNPRALASARQEAAPALPADKYLDDFVGKQGELVTVRCMSRVSRPGCRFRHARRGRKGVETRAGRGGAGEHGIGPAGASDSAERAVAACRPRGRACCRKQSHWDPGQNSHIAQRPVPEMATGKKQRQWLKFQVGRVPTHPWRVCAPTAWSWHGLWLGTATLCCLL